MKRIAMAMFVAFSMTLTASGQSGTTNNLPADTGNVIPTDNMMTEAPSTTDLTPQPMATNGGMVVDGGVVDGGVVGGSSCGCQGTTIGPRLSTMTRPATITHLAGITAAHVARPTATDGDMASDPSSAGSFPAAVVPLVAAGKRTWRSISISLNLIASMA